MKMGYVVFSLLCTGLLLNPALAKDKAAFNNPEDAASYSVGYQMGSDFRKYGEAVNPDMIAAGVRDALKENKPMLTEEEMRQELSGLQQKMAQARQKLMQEQAAQDLAQGEEFLAANAKQEGVVTLPSGLQYQVLVEGQGESPKASDTVTVNYSGSLIDGTEFDSSYKRGQPATFQLDQVIKGWTESLQLMKPGAKWKIFIPSKLAYGENGAGAHIPPNSTLIFEVELISVDAEGSKQN